LAHRPHWFAVVSPQICPALAPEQSVSTLQLPGTQLPVLAQT
jgi:hypothetical protein